MSMTSSLNETTRINILRVLACHQLPMTTREIATKLDMKYRTVSEYALKLWEIGTIERQKSGPVWVYSITDSTRQELKESISPRESNVSALAAAAVALLIVIALVMPSQMSAKNKNLTMTQVTVMSSESKLIARGNGKRLMNSVQTRAIVNGDHALLVCAEKHGCQSLGEGMYTAEVAADGKHEPSVFIHYLRPVDHADFREHWRIAGSW